MAMALRGAAAAMRRVLPGSASGACAWRAAAWPALGSAAEAFARANATASVAGGSDLTKLAQLRQTAPKKRAPADPDRPKRPASPWILFLSDYRKMESQKAEAVRKKGADVMRAAATEWKSMGDAKKKVYVEPYEKKKEVYEAEKQAYVSSGKQAAWKRDPEKPKRPMTGYLRYLQEFRARNSAMKLTEAAKAGGVAWKALSDQQKAPYTKEYLKEKTTYDAQMQVYKDSGKEAAWLEKTGKATAGKKVKVAAKPLAPRRAAAPKKAAAPKAVAKSAPAPPPPRR